jgi:hypothetical protein
VLELRASLGHRTQPDVGDRVAGQKVKVLELRATLGHRTQPGVGDRLTGRKVKALELRAALGHLTQPVVGDLHAGPKVKVLKLGASLGHRTQPGVGDRVAVLKVKVLELGASLSHRPQPGVGDFCFAEIKPNKVTAIVLDRFQPGNQFGVTFARINWTKWFFLGHDSIQLSDPPKINGDFSSLPSFPISFSNASLRISVSQPSRINRLKKRQGRLVD